MSVLAEAEQLRITSYRRIDSDFPVVLFEGISLSTNFVVNNVKVIYFCVDMQVVSNSHSKIQE